MVPQSRSLRIMCGARLFVSHVVLVAVLAILWPSSASATDRYVATGGVDTGACTNPSAPCRRPDYALSSARCAPGDTIWLGGGVYTDDTGDWDAQGAVSDHDGALCSGTSFANAPVIRSLSP